MFSESDLAELETWPYEVLGNAAVFMKQGSSYRPRENRQFSEMSSGPPISRLMSTHIIAEHTGRLELLDGELSYFEWWYANKINHGNDYFKINLMTGSGFNTVAAKFAKNGLGTASMKGNRHSVTCNLIAEELPSLALTEEQAISLAKTGTFKLQLASNGLQQVVNEDW
jgi:hypothetical protein